MPGQPHVDARRPDVLRGDLDRLGSPGQQPRGADAVAADVHERAASSSALESHVAGVVEGKVNVEAIVRSSPIAVADSSREPLDLRVVAVHVGLESTRPARSAASKPRSNSAGRQL